MNQVAKALVAALLAVIAGAATALANGITAVGIVVWVASVLVAFFAVWVTPNAPADVTQNEALDAVWDGIQDALSRLGFTPAMLAGIKALESAAPRPPAPASSSAPAAAMTVTPSPITTGGAYAGGGVITPGRLLAMTDPPAAVVPPVRSFDFSDATDGAAGTAGPAS